MRKAAVVGTGMTKFGEMWDQSLRDLALEASLAAVNDAAVHARDLEAIYVGNMSGGGFTSQEHVGALLADRLGLQVPAVRLEAACASGSVAFRNAYLAVASGRYDLVLVNGVEKMTDIETDEASSVLMSAGDDEWESSIGLTFAGQYALLARAHMNKFGTTREQLAAVSVMNHKNAVGNKHAQFPFPVTLDAVMHAPLVADPLRLLDCSPITDGSAAVIIASENIAKRFASPVWILASEQGADTIALHDRASLTEMQSAKVAGKRAFGTAGLAQKDIDVAELHDCFSINEIMNLEDLGFCEKGRGGVFVEQGHVGLDGDLPVNTAGGLKAIGHPVGATGVRQITDLVRQLRGKAANQVKGAKTGLALNIGGAGATAVVNILSAEQG